MALSATMYVFDVELADSDRNVYESLELRLARHPSETGEYLLARLLAYCLEYAEGIAFSRGLSDPDEPAISVRDLTGSLRAWIEVGAPDAERLHRASKASPRVAVYAHRNAPQLAERYRAARIHRAESLELYALDTECLAHGCGAPPLPDARGRDQFERRGAPHRGAGTLSAAARWRGLARDAGRDKLRVRAGPPGGAVSPCYCRDI
jgi:uncharacterized protein YaeQ